MACCLSTITSTSDDLLSIGPLGANFIEILIKIQAFSFKKMELISPQNVSHFVQA